MGILIALDAGWIVREVEKREIGRAVIWKTESGFKRLNNQIRDLLNTSRDIDARAVEKKEYAGREDDDLKKELVGIIKKYFYDNATSAPRDNGAARE